MALGVDGKPQGEDVGAPAVGAPAHRVSYLDRALWNRLAEATSPAAIAEFWLTLQCRLVEEVTRGVILLPGDGAAAFQPAAFWPNAVGEPPKDLFTAAERALTERRGVVSGHRPGSTSGDHRCCVAYPFVFAGVVHGAVAMSLVDRTEEQLREVMRQLQWGASWIELALRRQGEADGQRRLVRSAAALDLVAISLESRDFKSTAKSVATELARRLDCEFVAVGLAAGGHTRVEAISHSATIGGRMNLVRRIAAVLDEAVDQEALVLHPPAGGGDYRITLAHAELSALVDGATILTVPLMADGDCVGAICFARRAGEGFDRETIELCDAVASVIGPIIEEKRQNDRLILFKLWDSIGAQVRRLLGPGYVGRKLAALAIASVVGVLSVAEGPHRVTSPARIEGLVQRVIVAPFDGYVATQSARAGDRVRQGAILASLDDRDLTLERLRWTTTRQQRLAEYDQALARRERAAINIIAAQIEQADAQVALISEQLARLHLAAPFDGIVVSGDLSQSIGAAVRRGDELMRVAPLDAYRIMLNIDEAAIAHVAVGQAGHLKVASMIDALLPYRIEAITPVTEARDGRNYFRVEAALERTDPGLRPGMEGVAKTEVGSRLLIRIWTDEMLTWLRLKLWAWWP